MILHADSMVAFSVGQVTQAPVIVQCAQAAPESWLKWLLPTIVQTVVSLASIAAGVLIAVCSFRANKKSEHEQWLRNQEAGHVQWIRDPKKVKWRELLDAASECEVDLLIFSAPKVEADELQAASTVSS
jgi:hypothetical protein